MVSIRSIFGPSVLAVLALSASGCEAEPDDPELEFAPVETTDGVAGKADDPRVDVWARVELPGIETPHPYANRASLSFPVQVSGARRLRLVFSRFETEPTYDVAEWRDGNDRLVARYSGRRGAFTTAAIEGGRGQVVFRSDASVTAWGFAAPAVEVYGLGCLQDAECGAGRHCPQVRLCVRAPCFQTCEPLPAPPPPPPPPEGWSRSGVLAPSQQVAYRIDLPADAANVVVEMTGTGDADLYTRFGVPPTTAAFDCRPYTSSSNERCAHPTPPAGQPLHILVRGYTQSTFTVRATWGFASGPAPTAEGGLCGSRGLAPCAASLVCVGGDQPRDVPGRCRQPCGARNVCPAERYCSGDGLCLPAGGCLDVPDCSNPDNAWFHIMCVGSPVCQNDTCGWVCEPPPVAELDVSGQLARGQQSQFEIPARAGETLVVTLTGTGDADLYVRKGLRPSLQSYDCRPYQGDANETCRLPIAEDTTVYLMVHGYTESTFRLRTQR